MDKETFAWILQSALLSFEGISEKEMHVQYGINPEIIKIGVLLCNYLKSKELGK